MTSYLLRFTLQFFPNDHLLHHSYLLLLPQAPNLNNEEGTGHLKLFSSANSKNSVIGNFENTDSLVSSLRDINSVLIVYDNIFWGYKKAGLPAP